MVLFFLFLSFVYNLNYSHLEATKSSFLTHTENRFTSHIVKEYNIHSIKQENEYICTVSTEISDKTFENSVNIKSDAGCQSIIILKCKFNSINIPENSQSSSSTSIIYIKNSEFSIENSQFQSCSSNYKIPPDNFICHAIFIDENLNNNVYVYNCLFSNNGYENDPDGSLILLNKANNVRISYTQFESGQRSTSSIQSFYTTNVILSFNTFTKMYGSKNQKGGSISIQSSEKVSITDCIFDSNVIQPKAEAEGEELRASAFYVNFNSSFVFKNNTVMNHITELNSVVTFNKNDQILNSPMIEVVDSKYISNEYSKSFDGSGIGFYASEIFNGKVASGNFLNIVFENCLFKQNGDSSLSQINDAAGLFGWSKKNSTVSFNNCRFESNNVSPSSSLISIRNGCSLIIDSCWFNENINYCMVKFSPSTEIEGEENYNEIKVQITNISMANVDLTNQVEGDLILIENDSKFKVSLIIEGCTFSDVLLNPDNFILHTKSNLHTVQITDTEISYSDKSKSSNLMKFESSSIDLLDIIDCTFDKCLCVISSEITVKNAVISDCFFTDCLSGGGNLIGFLNQIDKESCLTVKSCSFEECTSSSPIVYVSSRELNFINNTINRANSESSFNALFISSICSVLVDGCTFTHCKDGCIEYCPTEFDESVIESIVIQNCDFVECSGNSAVASLHPFNSHPKLINITVTDSIHNFTIMIEMQQSAPPSLLLADQSDVLLQNVSFIDVHIQKDSSNGCGGCGFFYKASNEGNDVVSFNDCRFENNFESGSGGGAVCIQNESCMNYQINFYSCTFVNCYSMDSNGGTISITTEKKVQIENSCFENCRIESDGLNDLRGGAIYLNQTSEPNPFELINVTFNNTVSSSDFSAVYFECFDCTRFFITDCNFINCKTRSYQELTYNIISCPLNVELFECFNTNFIFDENSNMNPRVASLCSSKLAFNNCSFIRCGSKLVKEGGALYYESKKKDEIIAIENCQFEECDSIKAGCFTFIIDGSSIPTFSDLTVKKIQSKYSIFIDCNTDIKGSIQFNRIKFIENVNGLDGGGAGIWVTNYHDEYNFYPIRVVFFYCQFLNNYSPKNGGGYGIGIEEAIIPTQLSFYYCDFIGNHCNGTDGGGALWIRTSVSCSISTCNFFDNYASESAISNGGALYLSFASNFVFMTITSCVFVNNSCPHSESKGHVVYASLLYARMELSYTNLTDNGKDNKNLNSIIYSRSELRIVDCNIECTDKEKSFSRAIFCGASSDLSIKGTTICNCSIKGECGGAVYYESIRNRKTGSIEIIYDTFINNTAEGKGTELYFYTNTAPMIYNCSFYYINSTDEIIHIQFLSVTSFKPRYDRFSFFFCDFSYHHFISYSPYNYEELMNDDLTMFGCRYVSCCNVPLFFEYCNSLHLTECTFDGNTNNDYLMIIKNIQSNVLIDNCQFTNNKFYKLKSSEIAILNVSQVPLTVINTVFIDEEIETNSNDDLNSSIIKIDYKLNLTDVLFENSSSFVYSIFCSTMNNDLFYMENCVFNKSGSVLLNNWCQQTYVVNSSFCNSVDGFIYKPLKSEHEFVSVDVIQFKNNVFDGMTNRACFLIVFNDININNITVKNCQNVHKNNAYIFELDILNESINSFKIDHFTFENNKFDNAYNIDHWMNGGGIGFVIVFSYLQDEDGNNFEKEVYFSIVDCDFVSNSAENFGGAFAFSDSTENRKAIIRFDSCYFKGNTCKKLKGSALYLNVKNVSIENCIFESNSKLNDETSFGSGPTVYATGNLNPFTIYNCSFVSDQENSIYIENSKSEIAVIDSTFSNNAENAIHICDCQSDVLIHDCSFKTEKVANKEIASSLILVNTSSSLTISNVSFSGNEGNYHDYSIACYCKNSIQIDDTTMVNSGGIFIFPNSSISSQIEITHTLIKNSNYGLVFQPMDGVSSIESLIVIDCTFSSTIHALFLTLTNDHFTLKNNTICECINLDENEEKSSIIDIRIDSSLKLLFDDFVFENNKFSRPEARSKGFGGGIGLKIESSQKFELEFKNCVFNSNEAVNTNCSGGALYYVNDENIQLSLFSFTNCIFTENFASGKGGSLFIETGMNSKLVIQCCSFEMNRAGIDAAAVYVLNNDQLLIDSSQFINNSVNSISQLDSMMPADSLNILANADVNVVNCMFVKLSFPGEESNIQTLFSVLDEDPSREVSVSVEDSVYSVVNPTKSIVVLSNRKMNGKVSIYNASFTHFFLNEENDVTTPTLNEPTFSEEIDHSDSLTFSEEIDRYDSLTFSEEFESSNKNKRFIVVPRMNDTSQYVHIFITKDSTGSIIIDNSCFDTDLIYSCDIEKAGLNSKSDFFENVEMNDLNIVSVNENKVNSFECKYPSIIDDLIDQNFFATPTPHPTENIINPTKKNKSLLIGLVVGAVCLVLIVVSIVIVLVFIKKKKLKEKEEQIKKQMAKDKETTEELEIINSKFNYQTRAITQENPLFALSILNQMDNPEFEENNIEKVQKSKESI